MMKQQLTPWMACGFFLLSMVLLVPSARAQPSVDGQWTGVTDWPLEAIHSTMLPTGKVMVWQTWTESATIWDPVTGEFTDAAAPSINIFCSGHAWLPDGRLLVVGGHIENFVGEPVADIYDPVTNTWAGNVPDMNAGRWYPSATTLGNGDILVMSGDVNGQGDTNLLPQVYEVATNSWRDLTSAQKFLPLYPRTFLAPNGEAVVLSNYSNKTESLNTAGTGQWTFLDNTLDTELHNYGPAVMYDAGKVAYFGGGNTPTANISMMDLNDPNPTWSYAAEAMAAPRRQNDATILADGTVLITGGSSATGWNDSSGNVPVAEIWDPITQEVTQVAEASSVYRGYHSTATLLPDGRVLITGGDHSHNGSFVNNLNAEIYSPPYLSNGDRPTITDAPDSAELGETFFVETPDAATIADITFIVPGSTTHSQNWTQRGDHLDFTEVAGGIEITLPSDPNVAPPGPYMLFLINDSGVPSIAEFIQAELPTLPGDFDGNGLVDGDDLTEWQTLFGDDGPDKLLGRDFLAWQNQVIMDVPPPLSELSIPEPATSLLLLLGAGIVLSLRANIKIAAIS